MTIMCAADFEEVASTFQKRPCYRYLRRSDRLPSPDEVMDLPFERITAKVKLFNPDGVGTWWVAAYDPIEGVAWGVVELLVVEAGAFEIAPLVEYRDRRLGLPIERDLHFRPCTLASILEESR